MEEEEEMNYRAWDELIPDTLGLIFKKLALDEILDVVPRVCKSWAKAVRGSYCWQEIDIEEWSRYRRPESIDRMLHFLVLRSCGSLSKLSVYGLSTSSSLFLIADNAKSLRNLRLPRSEINDLMVKQVAGKLSNLTSLDLSYCTQIGAPALEAIGMNCKGLTCLQRNMHPWDVIDGTSQDDEASAIASAMPKLKHLEMAYLMMTIESVKRIVNNCRELELLDMRGCWNVRLEDKFLEKFPKLKVVGPLVSNSCGWDNIYCSGSGSFWTWGFSDMDYYDDDNDTDDDDVLFSDEEWDEVNDMEDLGLMAYDDYTDAQLNWD